MATLSFGKLSLSEKQAARAYVKEFGAASALYYLVTWEGVPWDSAQDLITNWLNDLGLREMASDIQHIRQQLGQ